MNKDHRQNLLEICTRIENSLSELKIPIRHLLNELILYLKKDYWLSHALIKFLNYEYDLGIKFKTQPKEVAEKEEDKELF